MIDSGNTKVYELEGNNAGSLDLGRELNLSTQYSIHSSLLPLFVPFYKSDKDFESPLEVENINHRRVSFTDFTESYIKDYTGQVALTGLSIPFYAVLFKYNHQKIKKKDGDFQLRPILGDYNVNEDYQFLSVETVTTKKGDNFLKGLTNLKVCFVMN